MADLSGRLRLPRVGLGATRPPQTLSDPGAVKPDTCPCTCTCAGGGGGGLCVWGGVPTSAVFVVGNRLRSGRQNPAGVQLPCNREHDNGAGK